MNVQVVTVSSKGQIALPAELRETMSISTGDKLAAYASGDLIMLKLIKVPTAEEFRSRLKEAQEWAAGVGYTEEDVNEVIRSVRKKAKA